MTTPYVLTGAQINDVIASLRKNSGMAPCLVCEGSKVTLAPQVVSLPAGTPGVFLNSGYIPVVVLTCNGCGFVRQHALEALGLGALGARRASTPPAPSPNEEEDDDE